MRIKGLSLATAASVVSAMALASPSAAGPDDHTLTIAWGATGPIENVDSYFNTARYGIWFTRMVWDQLVYRDPETFEYKPLLATGWEQIGDTTWRFNLRQGVTFHNGEPSTRMTSSIR